MKRTYLFLLSALLPLAIWIPCGLKMKLPLWGLDFSEGTKILWQNYDGPNYLIVEKTWYDKEMIKTSFSTTEPTEYFPAHFPLYPAVISVFDPFLKGPSAMLLATLIGSVLCFLMFYKYLLEFKLSVDPFWLTLVFMIFPARWLALRGVGSPEPWFILFILASLFYFKKEKIIFTGDTLFKRGIGRYDFSYSSKKELKKSLEKILKLPDDTVVYPGHGEKTTIGEEKDIIKSYPI